MKHEFYYKLFVCETGSCPLKLLPSFLYTTTFIMPVQEQREVQENSKRIPRMDPSRVESDEKTDTVVVMCDLAVSCHLMPQTASLLQIINSW